MSELDRALRITRAYANKARESLFPGESPETRAVKELEEALETGIPLKRVEAAEFTDYVETMTIEEAKIVLGVPNDAKFAVVKAQHQLLLNHLAEFEKKHPTKKDVAVREKSRVEKAFALLSASVDSTEKRFGSLEIN
jgi:chromosomal replication initiation ATPase DnaA